MPAIRLAGPPAWLQVVHGENVSNRVRGRLTSPQAHGDRFAHLLDDVDEPSRLDGWKDELLYRPGRVVRDSARSTTRSTALGLLGKERYSDAKLALTRFPACAQAAERLRSRTGASLKNCSCQTSRHISVQIRLSSLALPRS